MHALTLSIISCKHQPCISHCCVGSRANVLRVQVTALLFSDSWSDSMTPMYSTFTYILPFLCFALHLLQASFIIPSFIISSLSKDLLSHSHGHQQPSLSRSPSCSSAHVICCLFLWRHVFTHGLRTVFLLQHLQVLSDFDFCAADNNHSGHCSASVQL